jgi:predicted negative regulator of RcsB-dependent stress response
MVALALIGVIIMAALVGWGVWNISKSITMKRTTDRYRYVKAKDENGNEITKVIDLEDNEDEKTK